MEFSSSSIVLSSIRMADARNSSYGYRSWEAFFKTWNQSFFFWWSIVSSCCNFKAQADSRVREFMWVIWWGSEGSWGVWWVLAFTEVGGSRSSVPLKSYGLPLGPLWSCFITRLLSRPPAPCSSPIPTGSHHQNPISKSELKSSSGLAKLRPAFF